MPTISPGRTCRDSSRSRAARSPETVRIAAPSVDAPGRGDSCAVCSSSASCSPTSRLTRSALEISLTSQQPMRAPLRSTVTRPAKPRTSSRWWVTYRMPTPEAAVDRSVASRACTSCVGSVAVGSSSTTTAGSSPSCPRRARATATPVRWAWPQGGDLLVRVEVQADDRQCPHGCAAGGLTADAAEPGREPASQEEVVLNRHGVDERQVLVHEPAAKLEGGGRRAGLEVSAPNLDDRPFVRYVVAGQRLDKRRLA